MKRLKDLKCLCSFRREMRNDTMARERYTGIVVISIAARSSIDMTVANSLYF